MKRSEVQTLILQKLNAVQDKRLELTEAQLDLEMTTELLAESECDHPDTSGHVCDHCGVFDDNPENHEQEDFLRVLFADAKDFRASGLPNLSPYDSPYSYR